MHIKKLALVTCFLLSSILLAVAQPNIFPQEKTVDKVTVRITDARWINSQQVGSHIGSYVGGNESTEGFGISYQVRTENKNAQNRLAIYPVGPAGLFVAQDYDDGDGMIWWQNINPQWPKITATFEFLASDAPVGTDGRFEGTLEFKDVPLPSKNKEPLTINRVLTTAHGNQVILEAVVSSEIITADKYGGPILSFGSVRFIAHTVTSGAVKDMGLSLEPIIISDNEGREWTKPASTFDKEYPDSEVFIVENRPFLKAKSLNVKIKVREYAPSMRQEKWMRYIKFDLNPHINRKALGAQN